MASLNKVMLIGNLGKDPVVRYTAGGKAVANFSIATSEQWTDADGRRQERTEWHDIVVWGPSAENCGRFLEKGRAVHVEGRIQTREWTDKETGEVRRRKEIMAQNVTFLGGGRSERAGVPHSTDYVEPDPAYL